MHRITFYFSIILKKLRTEVVNCGGGGGGGGSLSQSVLL